MAGALVQSGGSILGINRPPWTFNTPRLSGGFTDYAGRSQTYAELYRVQPNVRLVVRFLARNISSLSLAGYRQISKAEIEDRPSITKVLNRPNPRTSRKRFVRGIVEDLGIYDDSYHVIMKHPTTGAPQLFRIPPQFIQPYNEPDPSASSWLFPEFYELSGSTGQRIVPADQVLHIHGHNPDDPRRGLSSLEALRRILAEEAAAGEWREQYWTGAARIGGVIERPKEAGKWSDPARERFSDGWIDAYRGTGGKPGRTPVLEDGMQYKPTTFSPQESEYLSARKLSREEVAAAYFIPPAFVGILENANFSNMDEQHVSLYADTLGPMLDDLESDFELQVLPWFDDYDERDFVSFDLDEKLRGSFEKQAAAATQAVGAPWLTRNEQRGRMKLGPIEGGDELVTPLNVLVGGLANPTDTAPPELPSGSAARHAAARKTRTESTKREVRKWDVQHRTALEDFFLRQSRSVLAGLGAGKTVGEAFDSTRWNTELAADLLPVAVAMNEDLGALSADRFGAEYDPARALSWLSANATIAAANINRSTLVALAYAVSGAKARAAGRKIALADIRDELGADDEFDLDFEDLSDEEMPNTLPDPLDDARHVFSLAVAGRAVQIATTRSTNVGNFSLRDGAEQAGARSKVWIVASSASRHPEMDGETVPIGEDFSIGGAWPGDSALDVADTAGCTCLLDFEQT